MRTAGALTVTRRHLLTKRSALGRERMRRGIDRGQLNGDPIVPDRIVRIRTSNSAIAPQRLPIGQDGIVGGGLVQKCGELFQVQTG